jgi:2-oxoglutarate ferredoxin oxidoreductase subunit delta
MIVKGNGPVIDGNKCQACGLCVSVCGAGVLLLADNVATVAQIEDCDWCTMCELVCPNTAISCPFEIVIEES